MERARGDCRALDSIHLIYRRQVPPRSGQRLPDTLFVSSLKFEYLDSYMVSLDLKYWQPANKKVLNKTKKPFNRLDVVGELPFCNFSIVNSKICLLIRAALQSAVCQDLYVLQTRFH